MAKKLGWKAKAKEPHAHTLLRSMLLGALGRFGDVETVKLAKKMLLGVTKKYNKISADLRGVVYHTAAAWGGQLEYSKILELHASAPTQEEQDRLARNLAYVRKPDLVKKFLSFALSKKVRNQDAPFLLASALRNAYGRQEAWKFIQKNWDELTKRFGFGGNLLNRIIQSLAFITNPADAQAVEEFFKQHPAPGARMTLRQALEKMRSQGAWLEKDYESIYQWLR